MYHSTSTNSKPYYKNVTYNPPKNAEEMLFAPYPLGTHIIIITEDKGPGLETQNFTWSPGGLFELAPDLSLDEYCESVIL